MAEVQRVERIERVRRRFRIAAIVLVIVGPVGILTSTVHSTVAKISQTGDGDVALGVAGVATLFVGLELFVARGQLVHAAQLHGLARRRFLITVVIGIAIVGSFAAFVAACIVSGYNIFEVGIRACYKYGC